MELRAFICSVDVSRLFAIAAMVANGFAAAPDWSLLRERLLDREIPGWRTPLESLDESVVRLLDGQNPDGSWPDVDYVTEGRASWAPAAHFRQKMKPIGAALGRWRGDTGTAKRLQSALCAGLVFWDGKRPKSSNWWWNTIGVQGDLHVIALALMPELWRSPASSPADLGGNDLDRGKDAMTAIYRLSRPDQIPENFRTGQNLVWLAQRTVVLAVMTRDEGLLRSSLREIEAEIRVSPGRQEGIKGDYSYHQHEQQIYNGGYGASFLNDTLSTAVLVAGTTCELSASSIEILKGLALEGNRFMLYRKTMDYAVKSREIARPMPEPLPVPGLAASLGMMSKVVSDRYESERIRKISEAMTKDADILTGAKYFPASDYLVYRGSDFMCTVKMNSTRMRGSESGNGENPLGLLLSDGAVWLYRGDGANYLNIFPCWDWQQIPGVTAEQRDPIRRMKDGGYQAYAQNHFAGGLADGDIALASMSLERETLRAKITRFFFGKSMLALGAGISCDSDSPVSSTLDQSLRRGDLWVGGEPLMMGSREIPEGGSFWHDGATYQNLGQLPIQLTSEDRDGSWNRINTSRPKDVMRKKIVTARFDHGSRPKGSEYRCLIRFGDRPTSSSPATEVAHEVIRNDDRAQVVVLDHGRTVLFVFHQSGSCELGRGMILESDGPVLGILRVENGGGVLTVSDPTQSAKAAKVSFAGVRFEVGFSAASMPGGSITYPFTFKRNPP